MTNEDKEELKEFLNGFLSACGAVAVFLVLAYFVSGGTQFTSDQAQTSPNERFKVVDKYDDRCDVIRYSPSNTSTYKYFLDCSK